MAYSKDGQDHKDIYIDTSRKILSQEMTTCNMKALILNFYVLEVMTDVNLKKNWSNVKIKRNQQKDFITLNTHVNYQSSSTHNSNVINKIKVKKSNQK